MDWFENKTTQLIALVSIVGTLAGFGYTGATYVNRLENLEAKIGGVEDTEDAQQVIEERFAAIETSVEYINKSIDSLDIPDDSKMQASIATLTNDVERLWIEIEKLEDSKNPLAN
jgi:chromosome segregation ATPase